MNFDNMAATATRLWPPAPSDRRLAWLPSGQEALLVVGLFGGEVTGPCAIANRLVDLPVFPLHTAGLATEDEAEAELLMHVDHEHGVGYIVLSAPSIGAGLLERASSLTEQASVAEVHAWLSDRSSAERALLVLFHLCHVVLHVSNARCADVRLLRKAESACSMHGGTEASGESTARAPRGPAAAAAVHAFVRLRVRAARWLALQGLRRAAPDRP